MEENSIEDTESKYWRGELPLDEEYKRIIDDGPRGNEPPKQKQKEKPKRRNGRPQDYWNWNMDKI